VGNSPFPCPAPWAREPLYYDALNTGPPADGVDLTRPPTNNREKYHSRYVDEQNTALFPFGYGLSYTKFTYSPLELSTTQLSASGLDQKTEQGLHVSTTVKNSGSRAGDEISELYVRLRGASVALPVRQLEGFRRLTLSPWRIKAGRIRRRSR
jgi:beta-glucosidase